MKKMANEALYKAVTHCRICKSGSLRDVMNLGVQSLSGRFPGKNEKDPPEAPLELIACNDCGLVQLKHTVTPDEMYTSGYGYRSGINQTMRDHLREIAEDASKRVTLGEGDCVLDVGCNDGTLLKAYPDGVRKIGIDAVACKFMAEYPADFLIYDGFFNAESYRSLVGAEKAKIITTISMFYDLEDPDAFAKDIKAILADDGVWILEQSYIVDMLEANSFDTVCHEHLEYYALRQIELLAKQNDLRVFDVSRNKVNGGSFKLFVCHKLAAYVENDAGLAELRALEADKKLDSGDVYIQFERRCKEQANKLKKILVELKKERKTVHIYGASTKGNITLQYAGIDHSLIAYAADRNPEKIGKRTPKTNIPIISEEESRAMNPDYFLVLPWHFKEEFVLREREFVQKGGRFIFPLPEVQILPE